MKRTIIGIIVCMLLITTPGLPNINGKVSQKNDAPQLHEPQPALLLDTDWWPMFGHDLHHSQPSSLTANWTQRQKLLASDSETRGYFGDSVSLSGDTALIGECGDDNEKGSAYVFIRNGTTWTLQQELHASDGAVYDAFGDSVSLYGDTALIGASWYNNSRGAAYVFTRTGTTWTQQAKLLPLYDDGGDLFGCSVSLSGDTALIGARVDRDNGIDSGSAYIFTRNGTTWTQQTKLLASDGAAGDYFGIDVSLSGDTALIGAFWDDDMGNNSGSAYVFTRNGTTWIQQAKLLASDGAAEDYFGYSVSLNGKTAIIAAAGDDSLKGSAYVFTRTYTTWTLQQKLLASDGAAGDVFSSSVSLSGNTALIGADGDDSSKGSAYVFTRAGTTWTLKQKLLASDGAAENEFGGRVSLNGDTAFIAALWDDDQGYNSGSVYVFAKEHENQPPYQPSDPIPMNNATGVSLTADLSWIGGDPDPSDSVTYDVYVGTTNPPPKVSTNQSTTTYDPGTLDPGITYYWKIIAWDNHSASTAGPVWDFTTNYPPIFYTPNPTNGSTGNPLSLTWSIPINDSEGDTFSWTIQCSNGQTNSGAGATNGTKSLALSNLAYGKTYKVWVNATDPGGSGLYTKKWYTFTTIVNLPPIFGSPNPSNSSSNTSLNLGWSIPINDSEGDTFSWTIQCSNGQTSSGTNEHNGTKTLTLSSLAYLTTYMVWVNATDPSGSGAYTRRWYTFTTQLQTPILELINIKGGMRSLSVVLTNIGNGTAENISWVMNATANLFSPKLKNGTIGSLAPGENATIEIRPVHGLGKASVTFVCTYRIVNLSYNVDFKVKQEWRDRAFFFLDSFPKRIQPTKEWATIENYSYMNRSSEPGVDFHYGDITNMHNVRVILTSPLLSNQIEFLAACKFTNGHAFLHECWITKDMLMGGHAQWEVELVDGG